MIVVIIFLAIACIVFAGLWLQVPESIALKRAKKREREVKDELARVEDRNAVLVRRIASLMQATPDLWFDDEETPVVVRKEVPYHERIVHVRHSTKISEDALYRMVRYDEWQRFEYGLRQRVAYNIVEQLMQANLFMRWSTAATARNEVEHTIMLELDVVRPDKLKYKEPTLPLIPKPNF